MTRITFPNMPTIEQVDLEVRGVLHYEERTKKKVDYKNCQQHHLDRWAVNYLRHQYFHKYKSILRKYGRMENPHDYLYLFTAVMEHIARQYPYLRETVERTLRRRIAEYGTRVYEYERWVRTQIVVKGDVNEV